MSQPIDPQGRPQQPQQPQQYPPAGQVPQGQPPYQPAGQVPQQPYQGQGGYQAPGQYPQGGAPGQYQQAGAAGPFQAPGAYPTQQTPQRPGYPSGGGFNPGGQAPPKKSNAMVLGIVGAGVLAVALLGGLVMTLTGGTKTTNDPTVAPTVLPTVAPTTAQPSPSVSTDPTQSPSPEPTFTSPEPSPTESTAPSPGDSLDVGLGVSVVPVDGWRQSYRDELKNYLELSDGTALTVDQAFRVDTGTKGTDVVSAYLKQLQGKMTGAQLGAVKTLDVKNDKLSVGMGSIRGTRATSQGSVKLNYFVIISVRKADGLSVLTALITDSNTDPAGYSDPFLQMAESLLNSQLKAP